MSMIDFFKNGKPGRLKHQTYTVVSTTISANEAGGQTVISVTDTTGMSSSSGRNAVRIALDDFTFHQTTISSIGVGTITIAAALPSAAAAGNAVVADGNYTFTLPSQAVQSGMLFATYCGGGQGGGGGHATGGGGGGGGASATFRDMPIYISGAGTLTVQVGIGGAGGAVGANGKAGTSTKITGIPILYSLPTGRCETTSLAIAGAAVNGGSGGDGAPMVTVSQTATSTTGIYAGPLGGTAGTAGVNGGNGNAALRRGYAGTTGGAGGGGGSTTSQGGSGGADEKHGDQSGAGNGSGGAGGGSFFGGAAYGGDPAGDPFGVSANGPGAGGGGGGTNGGGGNGGEGIAIFRWM